MKRHPVMAISLRRARSTQEIDAIFRGRHDAYAPRYMPVRADVRVMDRFDAYPTTVHLVAELDGVVVGALRMCPRHEVGTPSDRMFDFAGRLPLRRRQAVSGGMFWVRDDQRRSGVGGALLGFMFQYAHASGWTHVYAGINPEIEAYLTRMGFQRTGETFEYESLKTLPVLLDLADLDHPATELIERRLVEPRRLRGERVLLAPGEVAAVALAGAVLASGAAVVTLSDDRRHDVTGPTLLDGLGGGVTKLEARTGVELLLAPAKRRQVTSPVVLAA